MLFSGHAWATITGRCDNCHTMHNSQDGTYVDPNGPYDSLTRANCVGCHAMGTSNKIETIGGSEIPQVYHTDTTDLAAGNFAYIDGLKGSGASDAKGHNVKDLIGIDGTLINAPGSTHPFGMAGIRLTCSGGSSNKNYRIGCHGSTELIGLGMKGTHHQNVDGMCDTANSVYNSYRFLLNVMGLENTTDKWQNKDSGSHNEYYGKTSPPDKLDCILCHRSFGQPATTDLTISHLCGTCHGDFHSLNGYDGNPPGGIGGDNVSPFTRHPTDVVLPNNGEYLGYATYSVEAPVGRTTVPASPDDTVYPGTDVVTCISCHAAHGSNYPDMLRWDYSGMIAGGGGSGGGCFTCHTQKD